MGNYLRLKKKPNQKTLKKFFPRGCQRDCAGIKWEIRSCHDWYRLEAGQRDGNSRTGTNKHFPSEMSGVIWGNVNSCFEKRESNITAKHPSDIELTAWKKYIFIYKRHFRGTKDKEERRAQGCQCYQIPNESLCRGQAERLLQ